MIYKVGDVVRLLELYIEYNVNYYSNCRDGLQFRYSKQIIEYIEIFLNNKFDIAAYNKRTKYDH